MSQTTTIQSYLTFRLGDEIFGANVSKVSEILEIPKVTKVPRSPAFMRGVINLRGSVLPVIDAPVKFGLPVVEDTVETCIVVMNIIIEGQDLSIGVLVNAVSDVMEIDETKIQPAPTVGSKYKTEFIEGMVKLDDQFIMILNLDLVFSTDEASIIQELSNEKQISE